MLQLICLGQGALQTFPEIDGGDKMKGEEEEEEEGVKDIVSGGERNTTD